MEELLITLITPLVANPDEIRIEKTQNENETNFAVFIPKTDIAKVIGKEGKMIKSIKNLVKIRAIKEGVYVNIDVQEA